MRLVIQRVTQGSVEIEKQVISSIGHGYVVLVGIFEVDTEIDVKQIVSKLVNLRIMSDEEGKMNRSIKEVNGEILLVSQFTLCADMTYGRRPSFIKAMEPQKAEKLYLLMKSLLEAERIHVQTGSFGKYMTVNIENDGPVTIVMDS